jgi:hypothetical protein
LSPVGAGLALGPRQNPQPMPPVPAERTPERWRVDAGDAAQAVLTIPADARRERRFEIGCAMTVALREAQPGAWHQMTVLAGGAQQWQRREPTHNPGAFDGLDYRFSRIVPVGQALRIVVSVAAQGGRRRSLVVEADEV